MSMHHHADGTKFPYQHVKGWVVTSPAKDHQVFAPAYDAMYGLMLMPGVARAVGEAELIAAGYSLEVVYKEEE